MGANLLINVWGYCLASPFTDPGDVPPGLMHPRRIRDGVHKGCIDGGNQSGIPYGIGWEYFDERFLGKPLVFCGTVGTLPRQLHGKSSADKTIEPGDLIVMGGGRVGKDGIHGATFSSEELRSESPVQAVQIGDPITQKRLGDFLYEARDRGLYRFITDNGAGGLSCSAGEMAINSNGCRLELAEAPLKYPGMQPWEILLSEAQERMTFAVPPENIEEFKQLALQRDVEIAVMGEFTDTGKYHVTYKGETAAYIDLDFVHDGYPRLQLKAKWQPPQHEEPVMPEGDPGEILLQMMARLNVTSGEYKARQYDHEVKALSVVKPYVGVRNDVLSDAVVLMPKPVSTEGIILASAVLPRYSDIDTYHMAASVIDLAVRRTIAVGGKLGHIAGLDNFCWPDPVESDKTPDGQYKLAQLVRANQALYEYTKKFKVPCISGKDSMKNDSTRGGRKISIPPTLLYSTIARMEDISKALTLDAKRVGDLVYVLGATRAELGGSEYYAMFRKIGNTVPQVDAATAVELYTRVSCSTEQELCHSLHTPAIGGLALGFAKVAMGGRLGMDINLEQVPCAGDLSAQQILFSESNSRFIATVPESNREAFEAIMDGVACACVGVVTYEPNLTFYFDRSLEGEVSVNDLVEAYQSTLENL
jgi:phosphoribosylformylglycinamidine synthase